MAEKKRIAWIDQLRGIAFYFVIVGHMLTTDTVVGLWINSFHMPLFFLITGFTLNIEKTEKTKFKDLFITLSKRMLISYFFLNLISIFLKCVSIFAFQGKIVNVKSYFFGIFVGHGNILKSPSFPLYYVLLLFLARLGLWAVIKLAKSNRRYIAAMLCVLALFSVFTELKAMPWHINVVPTAMIYIFIGSLLMSLYNKISDTLERLKEPVYFAGAGILFVIGFVLQYINGRQSINSNQFGKSYVLAIVCAVITSVSITLLVIKLPQMKAVDFVGQNTLFLLGIHDSCILITRTVFAEHWQKTWFVIVASLLLYFLPIPLAWLFKKYAPYVCGGDLKEKGLPVLLMKYLTLALCFAAPWFYFTVKLTDGAAYRGNVLLRISYALVFFTIVLFAERVITKFVPVMFAQKKTLIKKAAEPVFEAEPASELVQEDIEVIIPEEYQHIQQ